MKPKITMFLCCLPLLGGLFGCQNNFTKKAELNFYNTIADQIIYDNYYQSCLSDVGNAHQDLISGQITESTYLRIVDSLKAIRKSHSTKCKIDYTDQLGIFNKNSIFDNDVKLSILDNLKDTSFVIHFGAVSDDLALDKLSRPANLTASDLEINYMDIVPHDKATPYG